MKIRPGAMEVWIRERLNVVHHVVPGDFVAAWQDLTALGVTLDRLPHVAAELDAEYRVARSGEPKKPTLF